MDQRSDCETMILENSVLEQEHEKFKKIERKLIESQQRYERLLETIPCAIYDYIRISDTRSKFLYISPQCRNIFGYDAKQIMKNDNLLWSMVHPDDLETLKQEDMKSNKLKIKFQSEVRIVLPSGGIRWVQITSMPSTKTADSHTVWCGVIFDITERRKAEENVKILNGLLPICANCKKIRDDKGYWNQIESYIRAHSDAEFSHGMCPECSEELYGNQGWFIEMKKSQNKK